MTITNRQKCRESGSILLVVAVFLAASIAALAGLTAGRVVHATRSQRNLEAETRAFNSAYAQIHMAMNVVNNSAYNEQNHNLALRGAIDGDFGGTCSSAAAVNRISSSAKGPNGETLYLYDDGTSKRLEGAGGVVSGYVSQSVQKDYQGNILGQVDDAIDWLDDPNDPKYGLIESTNVRVYRGRDYIKRLQRLKGQPVTGVDPTGLSDAYFVLEAAGRVGDTIRIVSALVRENEPFSSFVFFQNRATLGVSGAPRGLIHSNDKVAFYFPNGNYVDSVSAVGGFEYEAGATAGNTNLRNANPNSNRIDLDAVDFAQLKTKADLFAAQDGLDAEIKMYADGRVRIQEYTPPYYQMVEKSRTVNKFVGYDWEEYVEDEPVQVGTKTVTWEEQVIDHYDTVVTQEMQQVLIRTDYETRTRAVKVLDYVENVTKYRTEQVQTGTKQVTKFRTEDVVEQRTVTKTRKVKVWVPYTGTGAGGGTSVGGSSGGDLGEWVWQDEEYQTTENVKVGTVQVPYVVNEPVYKTVTTPYIKKVKHYKTVQEPYQHPIPVYENQLVDVTNQVPVYKTVTKSREDPVYEVQPVTKQRKVKLYVPVTETWQEEEYVSATLVKTTHVDLSTNGSGTIYIDGNIRSLEGQLNGRLTIVSNKSTRITDDIVYVDDDGDTAMKNGDDYTKPYDRNADYDGTSVLGVISRDDILFTRHMDQQSEVNGTLMAVNGRVGVDGFLADPATGELVRDSSKNRSKYLTPEQQEEMRAYDKEPLTRTRSFKRDSLRRIGGLISNNRVMETYVTQRKDGTSRVSAGFKRGNMKFDIALIFNPPPNFVEVPRPVLTYFVPVFIVRNDDA